MWNKGPWFVLQKLLLSLVAILCLIPAVYLVFRSLYGWDGFSFQQYEDVLLNTKEFHTWFWNTIFYTAMILFINIPVSILAAYGFSQYRFRGRASIFFLYMILMLLPFQATVVSQYLTLETLGLLDTAAAIILPLGYSTFGTFLLTQFMKGIDKEILEAARVDGASSFRVLWNVVLPLCKPAVVSLFILQLISCWSMVDQPLLFLRGEEMLPMSVKLSSYTFGASAFGAGVVYAVLPVLIYRYCQDALEKGISLSSIK